VWDGLSSVLSEPRAAAQPKELLRAAAIATSGGEVLRFFFLGWLFFLCDVRISLTTKKNSHKNSPKNPSSFAQGKK
jgi:hypothetical protein